MGHAPWYYKIDWFHYIAQMCEVTDTWYEAGLFDNLPFPNA